jgi:hypothetical protein
MDTNMTAIAQAFSRLLDIAPLRRIRRRIAAAHRRRRQLESMRVRDEYALAGFGLTRAELAAAAREGRLWQVSDLATPHPSHRSTRRRA